MPHIEASLISILDPGHIPHIKGVTRYMNLQICADVGLVANLAQGSLRTNRSVVLRRSRRSSITIQQARFVPSAPKPLAKEYMKKQKMDIGSKLNGPYSDPLVV